MTLIDDLYHVRLSAKFGYSKQKSYPGINSPFSVSLQ